MQLNNKRLWISGQRGEGPTQLCGSGHIPSPSALRSDQTNPQANEIFHTELQGLHRPVRSQWVHA